MSPFGGLVVSDSYLRGLGRLTGKQRLPFGLIRRHSREDSRQLPQPDRELAQGSVGRCRGCNQIEGGWDVVQVEQFEGAGLVDKNTFSLLQRRLGVEIGRFGNDVVCIRQYLFGLH